MNAADEAGTIAFDMPGAVRALPNQLADGWQRACDLRLPESHCEPRSIVIAGMGGSAIGADILQGALGRMLTIPLTTIRDYRLPGWVDESTLIIASSFSGDTEETIAVWHEATHRRSRRIALTSGGQLARLAERENEVLVTLPPGGPPRAALGHSIASLLGILRAARVLAVDPSRHVAEALKQMRTLVQECESTTHQPSEAARAYLPDHVAPLLANRVTIVYSPEHLSGVARRWKAQLNENAKVTAVWDTLPELHHNTIVGLARPDMLRDVVAFVIIDGPCTHERTSRRIQLTSELLSDRGFSHVIVRAPTAESDHIELAEPLWLCQFGDLLSIEVSHLHRVDPTPIEILDRLKAAMRSPGHTSVS